MRQFVKGLGRSEAASLLSAFYLLWGLNEHPHALFGDVYGLVVVALGIVGLLEQALWMVGGRPERHGGCWTSSGGCLGVLLVGGLSLVRDWGIGVGCTTALVQPYWLLGSRAHNGSRQWN